MRVAGILPVSFVNGEGARFVVFTQGCAHRCDGCQNPETWDFAGGTEMPVEQIAAEFRKHPLVDGITLSGGDPFYQQEECIRLLDLLPPETNVWAYTGFGYAEVRDTPLGRRADVLVCGPYVEELRCEGKMYGSSNQEIHGRADDG